SSVCEGKNAILIIVDGMGGDWVTLARMVGEAEKRPAMVLDTLPHTARVRTLSADNWITDSAASATAYATGVKTNNNVLGMDDSAHPPFFVQNQYVKAKDGKPLS